MKRLILFFAAVFAIAPRANAVVTLVQHRSVTYDAVGAGVPQTLAFSSNTTAGNFILVSCGMFDNRGGSVPMMYDSSGHHATNVNFAADASTFSQGLGAFANIAGGPTTIDCVSINSTVYAIIIAEYSGVDTRYPIDVFNQLYSASGTSKSAGAITTTQANEALCAFYYDDHIGAGIGAVTPPTGFTKNEESVGPHTQSGFADEIVSSIQTSINPSWSNASWSGDGVTLLIVSLHSAFSTASGIALTPNAVNATGTTASETVTNSSGDTMLVACLGQQSSAPSLSIADTQANSFTSLGTLNDGAANTASWWTVANVSAGSDTVTCTSSLTGSHFNLVVINYHGLAAASLDQHITAYSAVAGSIATPAQTAAITTTSAKEIVVLLQFANATGTGVSNVGTGNYGERFFFPGSTTAFDAYLNDQYFTNIGTYRPYAYGESQSQYFQLLISFVQGAPGRASRHQVQVVDYYHAPNLPFHPDPLIFARAVLHKHPFGDFQERT
jgi:hypothetical protein